MITVKELELILAVTSNIVDKDQPILFVEGGDKGDQYGPINVAIEDNTLVISRDYT